MPDIGRHHPTHGVHLTPGHPTIVFLTVCTKNREPWLADHAIHRGLLEAWHEANTWDVGRYLLMPDHIHLFCAPQHPEVSLETWVRFWKSRCGHRISGKKWQPHHWDTRLRRSESYSEKWAYVSLNPVRAGLVTKAEEWPYQGELHVLPW